MGEISGQADITIRCQVEELLSISLGDLERLDEPLQDPGCDLLAAGQRFQLLVGLVDSESPHHRLNGLGENRMSRREIGRNPLGIDSQLAESSQGRPDGEQAVSDSESDVS